jgi:hypothetical protein
MRALPPTTDASGGDSDGVPSIHGASTHGANTRDGIRNDTDIPMADANIHNIPCLQPPVLGREQGVAGQRQPVQALQCPRLHAPAPEQAAGGRAL